MKLPNGGGLYNLSVENIFVFIVVGTEAYREQRCKTGRNQTKGQQQNPSASGMEENDKHISGVQETGAIKAL